MHVLSFVKSAAGSDVLLRRPSRYQHCLIVALVMEARVNVQDKTEQASMARE